MGKPEGVNIGKRRSNCAPYHLWRVTCESCAVNGGATISHDETGVILRNICGTGAPRCEKAFKSAISRANARAGSPFIRRARHVRCCSSRFTKYFLPSSSNPNNRWFACAWAASRRRRAKGGGVLVSCMLPTYRQVGACQSSGAVQFCHYCTMRPCSVGFIESL